MKSNEALYNEPSGFLELALHIYRDACAKCIADVFDLRDVKTITSRFKDEGVSFLTITLPAFSKDFETSLRLGFIDPTQFRSFRKRGAIPAFLQGMLGRIFEQETGRINDEQNNAAVDDRSVLVDSVRQICLAFKKVELPCTPERVTKALVNFITIEQTVRLFSMPKEATDTFSAVASVLWGATMANICYDRLTPKHGPGSTADKRLGNQKFVWQRWHDRLEPFFPLIDSAYTMGAIGSREVEDVLIVMPEHEQPVKVVTVPKTLKGPRIIAIEPCCMQYAQQAIRRVLYTAIEASALTRGHVNFRDQSINQNLAIVSSKSGQFATIDLSDASDRVPRDLALEMFRSNPDLRDAIDACRSTGAQMPNGEIISPLSKFASMGSALCFPVESMYFYTICVVALLEFHGLPVNYENVFYVSRGVYVYGDDIIVPNTSAIVVLDHLQKYYCKVNAAKSFWSGSFRESCGADAYNGELVTPIYLRRIRPEHRRQATELISWVETGNAFYKKGYWQTARFMFAQCERVIGPLPYVSEVSAGLGRVTFQGYRSIERWNVKLQRFEMRCWTPCTVYYSDCVDGYSALMKSLSNLDSSSRDCLGEMGIYEANLEFPLWDEPDPRDRKHLERTALHGAVALKRRWVPSLS